MKIAYADCFSGVSGDMFLGALIDAGVDVDFLHRELAGLGLADIDLHIAKSAQPSLQAVKVEVVTGEIQPHRTWKDIRRLLDNSSLNKTYKEKSLLVFAELARAEAKIHGCDVDDIHFHEVGAVDAIVDIVGSVAGLAYLGIERLFCSPLPMPRGWVACGHGVLPVPAPAVCEILKGVPVYGVEVDQELVTPTGAALVKVLSAEFGQFPSMAIAEVGYGAGSRELPDQRPNMLRLVIGEARVTAEEQEVEVIETHIDDWSPEGFPYLVERLYAQGALDVVAAPLLMKKGRPGFLLRVVTGRETAWEIKRLILSETTAIGLRYHTEKRWTLPRQQGVVKTRFGMVRAKKIETPAGTVLSPEYEDCRRKASEQGVPLKEVYASVYQCDVKDFQES